MTTDSALQAFVTHLFTRLPCPCAFRDRQFNPISCKLSRRVAARSKSMPTPTNTPPAILQSTRVYHSALPFLLYRGGVDLTGSSDPEMLIEKTFATNNWGNMWHNRIYSHHHSTIHEAIGIAQPAADPVLGPKGPQVAVWRA
jgi:hypothetical protein